jgi:hypothetical protein
VKFLAWTQENLLRQVVYEGLREDKPARSAPPGAAINNSAAALVIRAEPSPVGIGPACAKEDEEGQS